MRIGELADTVGVNPKTIRYYEQIGLLPEPSRTPDGHRRYDQDDAERLAFIRRAQQLGLHLDEIGEVLALREDSQRPCDYVLDVARQRLSEFDERIDEMQRAREELHDLVMRRAGELQRDSGHYCGLIEHRAEDRV